MAGRGRGERGDAVLVSRRHHSYKHWAPHNSWETTKIKSSIQPIFIYFYVRDVKCKPEFSDWLSPIFWITQSSQSRIRGFLFFRGKSRNRKAAWTLPFIWLADWAKTVWRVGSDLLTLTVGYSGWISGLNVFWRGQCLQIFLSIFLIWRMLIIMSENKQLYTSTRQAIIASHQQPEIFLNIKWWQKYFQAEER